LTYPPWARYLPTALSCLLTSWVCRGPPVWRHGIFVPALRNIANNQREHIDTLMLVSASLS